MMMQSNANVVQIDINDYIEKDNAPGPAEKQSL